MFVGGGFSKKDKAILRYSNFIAATKASVSKK